MAQLMEAKDQKGKTDLRFRDIRNLTAFGASFHESKARWSPSCANRTGVRRGRRAEEKANSRVFSSPTALNASITRALQIARKGVIGLILRNKTALNQPAIPSEILPPQLALTALIAKFGSTMKGMMNNSSYDWFHSLQQETYHHENSRQEGRVTFATLTNSLPPKQWMARLLK